MRRIFLALLIVSGLASAAMAERRVALVLAAEDYKHLRPLSNPVNDARAMEALLESLGFEVWLETDRDLRRMRRALADFREEGQGADTALVFYAGHGVAVDGVNYLLPVDTEAKTVDGLKATSLPLSEVQETLAAISKTAIFLLDACRNDPFDPGATDGGDGRGAVALADDPPSAPRPVPGLGRIGRADGVLFVFAAAPGETASDGKGENSPFTAALLRHLATAGVELKSALTLVQQDVYDRSRGKQLPYIESGLPELIFISGQGDVPERDQLLLAMAGLTADLRAEVETVASANDMPLAPLYAALISGDLAKAPPEERQKKLDEAARSYSSFQSELVKYASDDPRVATLRGRAEEQLTLGSFEAARRLLTEAAGVDSKARLGLKENVLSRTLSEASTHVLNANAARTDLRYDLAIDDLTHATELFAEVKADLTQRDDRFAYAAALSDLGELYLVAGNSVGAMSIFSTRAEYLEGLSRDDPDDIGWSRELVWAFKSVGSVLAQQGYLREAEEAYDKAYQYSDWQVSRWPDDLDMRREREVILNAQGEARYAGADHQGALAAYSEALAIANELLDLDPDSQLYLRDVSYTQERIGDVYAALGDPIKAREAFDISLKVTQRLVERFPKDRELRRDLSVSYERLGDATARDGDSDSALAIYGEALKIREELAALDPSNTMRMRDTSITHERIGDTYTTLGDIGSALMSYQQVLTTRESLAKLDPQNAVWLRDLATIYDRIGDLYYGEAEYQGAQSAYLSSRDLRAAILAIDPANLPRQRDMGAGLEKLARNHRAMGERDIALALYTEALDLRRATAAADPVAPQYRQDIGYALIGIGDLYLREGDATTARGYFEEAIALRRALLAEAPTDAWVLRDLSLALNLQVEALLALREPATAATLGRESVDLMLKVGALRRADPAVTVDQFLAYLRLGDALRDSSDLAGALQAYRAMSGLAFTLSSNDPWNVNAAADYALALERVAAVYRAQEDYPAARAELETAVGLRRWVMGQQPAPLNHQRNLGYALRNLADTYYFEGNLDQGRPLEDESLTLMRGIYDADKSDAWNIIELVSGLDRMASYVSPPTAYLQEALGLLEALEAEGRLPDPSYRDWIATYRQKLASP